MFTPLDITEISSVMFSLTLLQLLLNSFMMKGYWLILILFFLLLPLCHVFSQTTGPGSDSLSGAGLGPSGREGSSSADATADKQGADPGSRRTDEELKVLAKRIESLYPDISQTILSAVREIPRKPFLPGEYASLGYENAAVPAENGSYYPSVDTTVTVLQYLNPNSWKKVLVMGINTGYAAALLSRLSSSVFVVELSETAEKRNETVYSELGIENITPLKDDALAEENTLGPFDSILIHGAVSRIPGNLTAVLAPGGVLIAPLRDSWDIQLLLRVIKRQDSLSFEVLEDELFPGIDLPNEFR